MKRFSKMFQISEVIINYHPQTSIPDCVPIQKPWHRDFQFPTLPTFFSLQIPTSECIRSRFYSEMETLQRRRQGRSVPRGRCPSFAFSRLTSNGTRATGTTSPSPRWPGSWTKINSTPTWPRMSSCSWATGSRSRRWPPPGSSWGTRAPSCRSRNFPTSDCPR